MNILHLEWNHTTYAKKLKQNTFLQICRLEASAPEIKVYYRSFLLNCQYTEKFNLHACGVHAEKRSERYCEENVFYNKKEYPDM